MRAPVLFAACPDRSLSGAALSDQFSIPHIVGGLDEPAAAAASDLFGRLGRVVRVSSPEAAEALKLFANVWRDARFGLANQFALYCSAVGADMGAPLQARQANRGVADHVVKTVLAEVRGRAAPYVAVLGLAFKGVPETADRRGSVGVTVCEALKTALGEHAVTAWDPCEGPAGGGAAAARSASVVVLANDHPALNDAAMLAGCAPEAMIYDLSGVLNQSVRADLRVRRLGAEYAS